MFKVLDYKDHSWNTKDYSKCISLATFDKEPEHVFGIGNKTYSKSIVSYKDAPIIFAQEFKFLKEPTEQYEYDDFRCPYCEHKFSDSWECDYDKELELECSRCGKEFSAIAETSVTYKTFPKED